MDARGLDRMRPDPSAFAEHFGSQTDVVTFDNLGGDATMIVPCPRDPSGRVDAYGHLTSFLREAPAPQRDALWREVGRAARARLGDRPSWINTAGFGVAWLHVRLDSQPKYYRFDPYRQLPEAPTA